MGDGLNSEMKGVGAASERTIDCVALYYSHLLYRMFHCSPPGSYELLLERQTRTAGADGWTR